MNQLSIVGRSISAALLRLGAIALLLLLSACGVGQAPAQSAAEPEPTAVRSVPTATARPAPTRAPTALPVPTRAPTAAPAPTSPSREAVALTTLPTSTIPEAATLVAHAPGRLQGRHRGLHAGDHAGSRSLGALLQPRPRARS